MGEAADSAIHKVLEQRSNRASRKLDQLDTVRTVTDVLNNAGKSNLGLSQTLTTLSDIAPPGYCP